eukprot:1160164-Pelagomonas_calceolata.AAC.2
MAGKFGGLGCGSWQLHLIIARDARGGIARLSLCSLLAQLSIPICCDHTRMLSLELRGGWSCPLMMDLRLSSIPHETIKQALNVHRLLIKGMALNGFAWLRIKGMTLWIECMACAERGLRWLTP